MLCTLRVVPAQTPESKGKHTYTLYYLKLGAAKVSSKLASRPAVRRRINALKGDEDNGGTPRETVVFEKARATTSRRSPGDSP